MASVFDGYAPRRGFLVCVDSDGCAMDTMDIKHTRCFGPCLVAEWGLDPWREEVLGRWNEINLYTMTRGVNRFQGLLTALREIDGAQRPIEGVDELAHWVRTTPELSDRALEQAVAAGGGVCLQKALHWSRQVNAAIAALPEAAKQPFPGVGQALAAAHQAADVAVVSSANRDAVEAEWAGHGLADHVDLILAQDAGPKARCIAALLRQGYDPARVLMVGDAPGDLAAAEKNGVWFYPILVRREAESWARFPEALNALTTGRCPETAPVWREEFRRNLGG